MGGVAFLSVSAESVGPGWGEGGAVGVKGLIHEKITPGSFDRSIMKC